MVSLRVIAAALRFVFKIFHNIRGILSALIGLKNPQKIKFKDIEKVIIDVTVQPIERPQKQQEKHYNRYKKNI